MAETIASMALSVWDRHGLPSEPQNKFCDWLLERTISLGKESATLPYGLLEQWMERYQNILLPKLGSKYTDLLIGELENERTADLNLAAAFQRCRIVFDNLWSAGEDDRPVLWEQLTRMVSVKTEEAVAFAWDYANRHKDGAGGTYVSSFVTSLSERLKKDMQDQDNWGVDQWEEGAKILLQIASTRANDLEKQSSEELANLAIEYSLIEDTEGYCTDIIDILEKTSREEAHRVISHMVTNLLTELPDNGVSWLAKHYHDVLNDTERKQIQKILNGLLSQPNVNDIASRKYARFFEDLTSISYGMPEIQAHIQHAYQMLQSKQNEFENFVKKVFQTMVTMLKVKVPDSVGSTLQQVFDHAQSQPAWLAWLHKTIAEYWPNKLPGLNMTTVFNNGLTIATDNPSQQDMDGILLSLAKLIMLDAVPPTDGNVARVVKLACDLWPYHREASLAVLKSFEEAPEPADIVKLMEGIDSADDAFSDLRTAWQHIVPLLDRDRLQQTTSLILSQSMIGPEDEPDRALAIWLDSMNAEMCAEVLHACLEDSKTPDEHKDRLWSQAINLGKKVEKKFYLDAIPMLFSADNIPKTQNTVIESADETNALFGTASEKSLLAKSLLNAFLKSSSIEMKRRIATWLHDIGGEAQLKDLNTDAFSVNEDDIEILKEIFPGKRKELEKYLKKTKQDGEDQHE